MKFYPDEKKIEMNLSDKDFIHLIHVYINFFPAVYFISSTPLSSVDHTFLNISQPHVCFKTRVVRQCCISVDLYFCYQPEVKLAKEK